MSFHCSLLAAFRIINDTISTSLILKTKDFNPASQNNALFCFSSLLEHTRNTKQSNQKHFSTLRESVNGRSLGLNWGISPQFAKPFLRLDCALGHSYLVGFILFFLFYIYLKDRRDQKLQAVIPCLHLWTLLMSCEYNPPSSRPCLYR